MLLAVSHGTASASGSAAVSALVAAVAAARGDLVVRAAHVDVQQPDVPSALAVIDGPVIIVPLLLSAGYHVHVDLARAAAARPGTVVARPLGPDVRLARVLARRIAEAGGAPREVVLAVAGSSDERANDDCRAVGADLAGVLGRPVTVSFLAAAQPDVATAVALHPDAVVSSYLLAPGYFHDRTVALAPGATVTRPVLDDDAPAPELVDIVIERYEAARTA